MNKPIVRQANNLVEASYKISLGESRMIRLLIAAISPQDEDFKTYRINVTDFAEIFGISDRDGRLYETISQASKSLMGRTITIKDGQSWLHMNWISSAEYRKGSGYIELCFDKKLKPYLLQLKGYFTQYRLEEITQLNSVYSIRIYELLKKEEFKADKLGKFKKSFEYEELREKLGIDEKAYKLFTGFRESVIKAAQKEISDNTDITIYQIDYPKTGRKISHIVFHCEKQEIRTFDCVAEPEQTAEKVHPLEVRELISFGIDEQTAYKWRKKYGVKRLSRNIGYTRAMQQKGKIRDSVSGFLCKAITDNLGGVWEFEKEELEKRRKAAQKAEEEKQRAEEAERRMIQEAYDHLMNEFEALPEETQADMRRDFERQLNTILSPMWDRAKKRNPERPESEKTVRVTFLMFFQRVQHQDNREDSF